MAGSKRLVRNRIFPAPSSTATASMSAGSPSGSVKEVFHARGISPETDLPLVGSDGSRIM